MGAGFKPVAVLTQPDRPAGRGRRLTASPVKEYALNAGIEVLQPKTLREPAAVEAVAAFDADVMVVAAYGLLLPQSVLDLPRVGCVNVHASLLPRWRGAAPIQAAILAGDAETGISLMRMDAGLDTGPVYVREAVPIKSDDTAAAVHDRLAALGGELLAANLARILAGDLEPRAQDDAQATYAGKIRNEDAVLDWRRSAWELDRAVRAFNPVPGARFDLGEETVKCWEAHPADGEGPAGTVLAAGADGIEVACGSGSLCLTRLQRPGRRAVTGGELAAQLGDLEGLRLA